MSPSDPANAATSTTSTPRVLGLVPAWALVAGSMLGVGIYLSPPVVAGQVSSAMDFLWVWIAGGVFAFAGAVAYAELGTLMPRAGGDYVFHRRAFGPAVAFASGWVLFAAIFCGSAAAMAAGLWSFQLSSLFGVSFGEVGTTIAGHPISVAQVGGVGLILALTAVSATGAKGAGRLQAALTGTSIVVLLALGTYALAAGEGHEIDLTPAASPPSLSALTVAYMAVYFAYSGWNAVTYVAGEVRDPARNVPRALLGGVLTISGLYLLMLLVFLRVLGLDGVREAGDAGAATAAALGGETARLLLAGLVAGAIIAAINGTLLAGARIVWAMAQDGAFATFAARLSPRTHVPVRALWLQAAWTSVLVLSGSFERLLELASLAMALTGALTVAALFVLRHRMPDAPRPYRATGYPWLPGAYLASSALAAGVMVARALCGEPGAWQPLFGLGVLIAAWSGRAVWLRFRGGRASRTPNGG